MEDTDKLIRSLQAQTDCFDADQPGAKAGIFKRLARKLTLWYIHPFGAAQNRFNATAAQTAARFQETANALSERLDAIEAQTERRISAFALEQRQTLARNYTAQQEAIGAISAEVDRSLCKVAPAARSNAGLPPLTQLAPIGPDALYPALHAVQTAATDAERSAALDSLETGFADLLQDALQKHTASRQNRPIAVIYRSDAPEAVRQEAEAVIAELRTSGKHPVRVAELAAAESLPDLLRSSTQITEDALAAWLRSENPALLFLISTDIRLMQAGGGCMLLRPALIRLLGSMPAKGLGGSQMQELLHLCDIGLHRYCTASRTAAENLEALGFRRPAVCCPSAPEPDPRHIPAKNADPSFAVLVMLPEEPAAADTVCELMRTAEDLRFVCTDKRLPEALRCADNVKTQPDSELPDCLLIPAPSVDCPPIAVTAMYYGIPVVTTSGCGIAELIGAAGIGRCADTPEALADALRRIRDDPAAYSDPALIALLRRKLQKPAYVQMAEEWIAEAAPDGVCTLYDWDRQVKQANGHLVLSSSAMRASFQRRRPDLSEPAYPRSAFKRMQRQSAVVLLRQLLSRQDAEIFIPFAGNGDLLGLTEGLGHVTAADPSGAMVGALREKYKETECLQCDLLDAPQQKLYDAIMLFSYLRHFSYTDRKQIWQALRERLNDGGVLIFDVPNLHFTVPHRRERGWGSYPLYDVFWTADSIQRELAENGFALEALIPVGQGLYPLPADYRAEPVAWTAAATLL